MVDHHEDQYPRIPTVVLLVLAVGALIWYVADDVIRSTARRVRRVFSK